MGDSRSLGDPSSSPGWGTSRGAGGGPQHQATRQDTTTPSGFTRKLPIPAPWKRKQTRLPGCPPAQLPNQPTGASVGKALRQIVFLPNSGGRCRKRRKPAAIKVRRCLEESAPEEGLEGPGADHLPGGLAGVLLTPARLTPCWPETGVRTKPPGARNSRCRPRPRPQDAVRTPPAGAEQGSPPTSPQMRAHLCVHPAPQCAQLWCHLRPGWRPLLRGPAPRGPGGQCRGCPETGGVSHRWQSWLGKVPAGLLDTATQAGPLTCGTCGWSVSRGPRPEAHAALDMGVKGASPRAESCPAQHGQRCAPCRACTLSHVPTPALSTLPVGPTLCGGSGHASDAALVGDTQTQLTVSPAVPPREQGGGEEASGAAPASGPGPGPGALCLVSP